MTNTCSQHFLLKASIRPGIMEQLLSYSTYHSLYESFKIEIIFNFFGVAAILFIQRNSYSEGELIRFYVFLVEKAVRC